MLKETMTCDGCGKVIPHHYGWPGPECIRAFSNKVGSFGNSREGNLTRAEHHFCRIACLRQWLATEEPTDGHG